MTAFDNNELEKYKIEAQEKWGETEEYKEYTKKTKDYSKEKWNDIVTGMEKIMQDFSECMKNELSPETEEVQNLVEILKNHISDNYYLCTNEILAGLGKMYVLDERFKNNIDKNGDGTALFICEAINVYCYK